MPCPRTSTSCQVLKDFPGGLTPIPEAQFWCLVGHVCIQTPLTQSTINAGHCFAKKSTAGQSAPSLVRPKARKKLSETCEAKTKEWSVREKSRGEARRAGRVGRALGVSRNVHGTERSSNALAHDWWS